METTGFSTNEPLGLSSEELLFYPGVVASEESAMGDEVASGVIKSGAYSCFIAFNLNIRGEGVQSPGTEEDRSCDCD